VSLAGLAASCAVLAVVLTPVALGIAALCHRGLTETAWLAAAVAGGVCWAAAALALVSGFVGNRWDLPVQGVLLGMLFRMGLPLAAVVFLPRLLGAWAAEGLARTILGVYLSALVAETLLALRMFSPPARAAKAA
jgi:hypothetical protein